MPKVWLITAKDDYVTSRYFVLSETEPKPHDPDQIIEYTVEQLQPHQQPELPGLDAYLLD